MPHADQVMHLGPKAATLRGMKSDIPTAPLGDITPETAIQRHAPAT
jgi:hypothetical protein